MENSTAQKSCPLCQESNNCAVVRKGMASQCWCMQVKIAPQVLAQLMPAQKNITCICQKCAQTFKA